MRLTLFLDHACNFKCTYCYNHLYRQIYQGKGKLIRRRGVDHVMEELKQLKTGGYKFIRFMDDLFILHKEWTTYWPKVMLLLNIGTVIIWSYAAPIPR